MARFEQANVELYRVTFSDGCSVRVCGEHLWRIQSPYDRKLGRERDLTTLELLGGGVKMPSGQNQYNIPVQGSVDYAARSQPLDPYVFGLWLGDGVANEATLVCPDEAIREELTRREMGWHPRRTAEGEKDIWFDGISGLRETGVSQLRSHEKYIPERYKRASRSQRLDLLRGLMDADGTVCLNGQTYLASSSARLIDDFIWLARSLGYCAWRGGPYPHEGFRDGYRAMISGPEPPFLAAAEKCKRWHVPEKHRYTRYIESIDPDGSGDVVCIGVGHRSSCFQIGDFIVTHNCKGPGKTCLLAWLIWNFLLTRPHAKIAATSITGDNLRDCLWAELAKWQQKSELLKELFTWQSKRIFANDHPDTHWASARTWSRDADPEQQADTLAGLHADYMLFVLDESGGMPEAVMAAAEAAMASGIETHIVQAGNPTQLSGPLYRASERDRKLWRVWEITGHPDDPKRTPRMPVAWAREMMEAYGVEHPWVLVNVFGRFPPHSWDALIGPSDISAAERRSYRDHDIEREAKILGVDVARFGDDQSVVFPRQGLVAFTPGLYRNIDGFTGAAIVNRKIEDWGADAAFIDDTGGFGATWIDPLRKLGQSPLPVHFSAKANDKRYFNKRAEMYWLACQWIKDGGQLPGECPELGQALTQMTYTFRGDAILIEDKVQLKARLGMSPDVADAFALTFAEPVTSKRLTTSGRRRSSKHLVEYDPYELTSDDMATPRVW
jgi:hypothetical protein